MGDRLAHDPRWPRAGAWPAPAEVDSGAPLDLTLLGVPAWRTSLSPTNAHTTPAAIRDALRRYSPALTPDRGRRSEALELSALRVADAGDVEEPDGPDGERRTSAAVASALERSQTLLALGGDNSATVATALGAWGAGLTPEAPPGSPGATDSSTPGAEPAIRPVPWVQGSALATAGLVTIDAHFDLRDGVSNGSPVRRLIEAGLDPSRVVQIGIADFANSASYARRALELGITVVHRDELHRRSSDEVMREALSIAGAAGGPIHLDIDVDVCDRSVAPACPASVPGGLAAWELRALVRAAARDRRVRSADLVEIDATADAPDGRTVRLAALCVLEFLAGVAER